MCKDHQRLSADDHRTTWYFVANTRVTHIPREGIQREKIYKRLGRKGGQKLDAQVELEDICKRDGLMWALNGSYSPV